MFRKISTKMIFSFTTIIIVILALVSTSTFLLSKNSIENNAQEQANATVQEMVVITDLYLNQFAISVDRYSHNDNIIHYLRGLLGKNSNANTESNTLENK